jgi:hypothetical protein
MKTLLTIVCLSGALLANAVPADKNKTSADSNNTVTPSLAHNSNTDWVDAQIAAIKPPRQGIADSSISRVKSPFIYIAPKVKAKTGTGKKVPKAATVKKPGKPTDIYKKPNYANQPLRLAAVMNENAALINGTWYQVDDKVRGYRIVKIEKDAVVLKVGKRETKLSLTSDNENIKIQIK